MPCENQLGVSKMPNFFPISKMTKKTLHFTHPQLVFARHDT
eukprot:UN08597